VTESVSHNTLFQRRVFPAIICTGSVPFRLEAGAYVARHASATAAGPMQQTGCWFVGGDKLTGALRILQLQLSPPPPSSLAPTKSRMETFWY